MVLPTVNYGWRWWARLGSNQRPAGYEPAALPLSYGPPYCSKRITFNYTFHLTHKTRPTPEEEQDDCKATVFDVNG